MCWASSYLAMNLNYLNKLSFMKAVSFVAVVRIRTAVTATQTQKLHILPSNSGGSKICRAKKVAQGVLVFCFQKAPESRASPCHCLGKTDYNVTRKGVFSASVNCISRKVWKLALKTNNNCISHRRVGQRESIGYSLMFLSSKQTTLWLSALKQIHYTSKEAMRLCFPRVSGGYPWPSSPYEFPLKTEKAQSQSACGKQTQHQSHSKCKRKGKKTPGDWVLTLGWRGWGEGIWQEINETELSTGKVFAGIAAYIMLTVRSDDVISSWHD